MIHFIQSLDVIPPFLAPIPVGFTPLSSSSKLHARVLADMQQQIKGQMSKRKHTEIEEGKEAQLTRETWELFPYQLLSLFCLFLRQVSCGPRLASNSQSCFCLPSAGMHACLAMLTFKLVQHGTNVTPITYFPAHSILYLLLGKWHQEFYHYQRTCGVGTENIQINSPLKVLLGKLDAQNTKISPYPLSNMHCFYFLRQCLLSLRWTSNLLCS